MFETERLESEHSSQRDCVIASERRLSHVSIGQLLRWSHSSAIHLSGPQVLQRIHLNYPQFSVMDSILVPRLKQ